VNWKDAVFWKQSEIGLGEASYLTRSSLRRPISMTKSQFLKLLVWINGAVPGLMLGWDAYRGQLGANSVNDAIRTTGLLALVMLSLSLCVTPLRRLVNWPELISVRRALGLWGFFYAAIHLSIYVGLDRALDLGSALEEVFTRRYLQVGIIAVLLMLPLALTSNDTMVRRLGGKRWKQLHRLAYLAIALGVLHYYLLVKSDVRQPLAFAGVLAVLLGSRVGWKVRDGRKTSAKSTLAPTTVNTPATKRTNWKGELRVARIFVETPEVRTFRLVPVDGGMLPFDYLPGQYLTIEQMIDGSKVTRCYTIASSPSRAGYCEISVKREPQGLSSRNLHDHVREGDRVLIRAPAGKFVFTGSEASRLVVIAGGVGITPMMSITRYLTDICWKGPIDVIIAARTREHLIFRDELELLAGRFPNLTLRIVLSSADDDPLWTGERGHLSPELLRRWVDDWNTPLVYLCGPQPMMDAVTNMLLAVGAPPDRIRTEAFVSAARVVADATAEAPPAEAELQFKQSRQSCVVPHEISVLEAAEQLGIDLPFECRSGICGQCKVKLTAGRVKMHAEDALSSADKAEGYILACQAHALCDLAVDA
jgi:glycine betaine catabolism B